MPQFSRVMIFKSKCECFIIKVNMLLALFEFCTKKYSKCLPLNANDNLIMTKNTKPPYIYWSNNDQSVPPWRHQTAVFRWSCRFWLWYRAWRLNSRYVEGSGWYVESRAVAWRHTDMHETWDPEQWLWTLTSGNSVDADLWGAEVTRGSTSFLFEKGRASKTENRVRKP